MKPLRAPEESLGDLDANVAATLLTMATDVALIMDRQGVINDLAFGNEELSTEGHEAWLGQHWVDTVSIESRPKVEALLRDASACRGPKWRQVNHPSDEGNDLPIRYSAIQIDSTGRIVALGRELRSMASLQQRLVDVQQSMEQEYIRLRHAETRYRLLFQTASEAVLILDAGSRRVSDANPATTQLLELTTDQLAGRIFPEAFEGPDHSVIQNLLDACRRGGRHDEVQVRLGRSDRSFQVSASLFRQEGTAYFLVRLAPAERDLKVEVVPRGKSRLLEVIERLPEGFAVTDFEGRILTINSGFLDLVQLATEEQVQGQFLERWVGRPGIDLNILNANLREHGSVRLFATIVRGEYGTTTDAEVSAVAVAGGDPPCLGFSIRKANRRGATEAATHPPMARSVDQMTELVGRVPLKELVRESTDLIERLCIEAALQLTENNRASAAETLGLSRQSLYVKLRRYGLADLAASDGDKS